MDVLLISTELYPSYYVGGLGVAVRSYFDAYRLAGIDASVIAVCREKLEKVYCVEPDGYVYSNIDSVIAKLIKLADSTSISGNVLHANDWFTFKIAEYIKNKKDGKIVLTVHLPSFSDDEKTAIEKADLVIVVSNYELSVLEKTYGSFIRDKAVVVYNVTDWTVSEARQLAEKLIGSSNRLEARRKIIKFANNRALAGRLRESCEVVIISWGRLTGQKNHILLVPLANTLDRNMCILIVGRFVDDPYAYMLMAMINAFNEKGSIALIEDPGSDYLKALVYASNVSALPYVFEPFGIASIESQALGTPVVVNADNGLAETVEYPSMAVSIKNVERFFKVIKDLAYKTHEEDIAKHEKIRAETIKHIDRKFRLNRMAEDLKKIYYELVATRF
jgi:glycogen synthase